MGDNDAAVQKPCRDGIVTAKPSHASRARAVYVDDEDFSIAAGFMRVRERVC